MGRRSWGASGPAPRRGGMSDTRATTPIDAIAEDWVTTLVDLVPDIAIYIGVPGRTGEYGDLSPAGHARLAEATRELVRRLEAEQPRRRRRPGHEDRPAGRVEAVARGLRREAAPARPERDRLAAQEIRESSTSCRRRRRTTGRRSRSGSANVPGAVAGYIETLRAGIAEGVVPASARCARCSSRRAATHARTASSTSSPRARSTGGGIALPDSLRADLHPRGRGAPRPPTSGSPTSSRASSLPAATETDGVGRELYALQSRHFLGAEIDLDETYEWGIEELERMIDEQTRIASEIKPGATVAEADRIPRRRPERASCTAPMRSRRGCRSSATEAVDELGRSHFDIPEPVRALECMIAPTQEGGIYYTGPSDDFSAPGSHVVERAGGRHRVRHLARDDHRLPRGRSGPPPADRAGRVQPRASSTPGAASSPARAVTPRAGRSTPSGSWRSSATSTTRPTGSACSTGSACAPHASCSTSACTWKQADLDGTATWDADYALRFHARQRQHERRVRAVRGEPLPRLARAGAVVQGRASASGSRSATPRRAEGEPSSFSTSTSGRSTSAAWSRHAAPGGAARLATLGGDEPDSLATRCADAGAVLGRGVDRPAARDAGCGWIRHCS